MPIGVVGEGSVVGGIGVADEGSYVLWVVVCLNNK